MRYKHLKYENFEHFVVYEDGKIQNTLTGNFLVGDINNVGYSRVCLYNKPYKKRFFVHRLVAEYFVDGFDENLQVNHKDGNKLNNHYMNLEWVTQSENEQHKQKYLNPTYTYKPVIQTLEDGTRVFFKGVKQCAEYNKVNRNTITRMLKNKSKNRLNVEYA